MIRSVFGLVFGILVTGLFASAARAQQSGQEQPPAAQPRVETTPAELVPATKEETWTLGGQQWDFKDIATAYRPVKGALDPKTGVVVWTLEIVKELTVGEIGMQENQEGSPFKPTFLDEEKIAVQEDALVRISKISGKVGDGIRMTMLLPKPELLDKVKLVRIARRTKVGF